MQSHLVKPRRPKVKGPSKAHAANDRLKVDGEVQHHRLTDHNKVLNRRPGVSTK